MQQIGAERIDFALRSVLDCRVEERHRPRPIGAHEGRVREVDGGDEPGDGTIAKSRDGAAEDRLRRRDLAAAKEQFAMQEIDRRHRARIGERPGDVTAFVEGDRRVRIASQPDQDPPATDQRPQKVAAMPHGAQRGDGGVVGPQGLVGKGAGLQRVGLFNGDPGAVPRGRVFGERPTSNLERGQRFRESALSSQEVRKVRADDRRCESPAAPLKQFERRPERSLGAGEIVD